MAVQVAPAVRASWANRVIARQGAPVRPVDATTASRRSLATRCADWLAEKLLGPEETAYRGQLPGAAGRLANRLAPGESAMLTATGTATVPAAVLARWLPGATALPDVGGSLRMAGMLARKKDGKLMLTLTFQAGESASTALGGGLSAGLSLGGRRYGFKLGAEKAIGASANQLAVVTLKFDPTDPEDARRLADLLAPDFNPLTPSLQGGTALSRAMAHNKQAFSVGGSLGADLGVTFGGNVGELDPTDGQGVAADSPWAIKAKLGLLGSASAEVFRTWAKDGAVTDMVGFEAGVEGAVKLPAIVKGKLTDRAASAFNVTRDREGKLVGLSADFTDMVSARALADMPWLDLGGRGTVKVVTSRPLNEAGLTAARALLDAGHSPLSAYTTVARDPAMVDESRVEVAGRTLMLGLDGGVSLGGHRMAMTGLVAGGKMQRQASDDKDPGLRELLMLMKGTMARSTV